ncbi:hypothetical protein [Kingella sp. (in: b-proteobacteria)]|uniref:hypothetical protein n=1 Tax=Kingella sp. (in: b-proteobacteria) TaxID=2020713 RepID=UPI0026DCBCEC|nr:hypothetical protein [Kingella sp. (in: b-proteobacteria)]MDO4658703.1 hypothetical protein [Kingella sp. (in: b-proteobacteria)]
MYSISCFQQIIKPLMHGCFQKHVQQHQADKHSKGFGCHSLRTLEQSFNAHSHHHYHPNVRHRIAAPPLPNHSPNATTAPLPICAIN